jgi:Cu2+-exporting ATPase
MLTGESMPVLKQPGDTVVAGTLNQSGAIALKVTGTGSDTSAGPDDSTGGNGPEPQSPHSAAGGCDFWLLHLRGDDPGHPHLFVLVFCRSAPLARVMDAALGPMHDTHTMTHAVVDLLVSLKLAIAVMVIACPCALGWPPPPLSWWVRHGSRTGPADSRRRHSGNRPPPGYGGVRQNRHPHPGTTSGHREPMLLLRI